MITQHLQEQGTHYIAAVGGAGFSILNGASIANGVVAGVIIWVIANMLKKLVEVVYSKISKQAAKDSKQAAADSVRAGEDSTRAQDDHDKT